MGLTVAAVFDSLKTQLTKNPQEFAMVILNYQSEGGEYPRNVPAYAKKVAAFYDAYTRSYRDELKNNGIENAETAEIFKLYSPDITLSDVRGKIMLVMRTTQEDEDPSSDFYGTLQSDGTRTGGVVQAIGTRNILAVDGCGSGKDKWRRRGYSINGAPALNIYDSGGNDGIQGGVLLEEYMVGTSNSQNGEIKWNKDWNEVGIPDSDFGGNFSYNCTNGNSETSFNIWFQEWVRVVPNYIEYYAGNCGTNYTQRAYYYVRWHESYNEKFTHATKAFEAAIRGSQFDIDDDGSPDPHVFINSLCGYFVDDQTAYKNSCIPWMYNPDIHTHTSIFGVSAAFEWGETGGLKGNIDSYAQKINTDFYNYVLTAGIEQSSGPTGVVMMDRVSNQSSAGGSYYLPGVIIGNNFKY